MYRAFATIAAVAVLSGFLAHLEHAQGERVEAGRWVRTADGWEPSGVLRAESHTPAAPELHPLLVAGFLLGASIFALLAFPNRKMPAKRTRRVRVRRRHGRHRKPQLDA